MVLKRRRTDPGDVLMGLLLVLVVGGFSLACLLPMIHVLGMSLTSRSELGFRTFLFFPLKPTIDAYLTVFASSNVMRGVRNSTIIAVFGTLINLFLTSTFAYVISKSTYRGAKTLNFIVVFSMLFPPGIIPLYLVVRSMGLLNTLWSLMLPLGIDAYFCILMRNFYESLPDELFESAEIEGAAEWQVYWRIALPLSKAGLAAITLFYAVLNWNSFFHAMMFISKQDLWPIQIWLQNLINTSYLQGFSSEASGFNEVAPKAVQMAVVMVSMVPILLIYPFLQKHFSKGILLGSVKG